MPGFSVYTRRRNTKKQSPSLAAVVRLNFMLTMKASANRNNPLMLDIVPMNEYNMCIVSVEVLAMEFLTTKQASELWGISQRRVAILCEEGRIDGAVKAGRTWLMPISSEKPTDARIKSERSMKTKTNEIKRINKRSR